MKQLKLKLKVQGDQDTQPMEEEKIVDQSQSFQPQKQNQLQIAKTTLSKKIIQAIGSAPFVNTSQNVIALDEKQKEEIVQIINQIFQFTIKINLQNKSNFKDFANFNWAIKILLKCDSFLNNKIMIPEVNEQQFMKKLCKYFQETCRILQNSYHNQSAYNTVGGYSQFIIFLYKLITAQLKSQPQKNSSSFFTKLFSQSFVCNFTSDHIFGQINSDLLKPFSYILIKISQSMNYSLINKKVVLRMSKALIQTLEKTTSEMQSFVNLLLEECFKIILTGSDVKFNKSEIQLLIKKIKENYRKEPNLANIFMLQSFLKKLLGMSPSFSLKLAQQYFIGELLNYDRYFSSSSNQEQDSKKIQQIMIKIEDLFILCKNYISLAQKSTLIQEVVKKISQISSPHKHTEGCVLFYLLRILNILLQDVSTQECIIKLFQANMFQLFFKVLEESNLNFFLFKMIGESVSTTLKLIALMIMKIYLIKPQKNVFIKLISANYYERFSNLCLSSNSLLGMYLQSQNISQLHKQMTKQYITRVRCTLKMPIFAQIDTTLE